MRFFPVLFSSTHNMEAFVDKAVQLGASVKLWRLEDDGTLASHTFDQHTWSGKRIWQESVRDMRG